MRVCLSVVYLCVCVLVWVLGRCVFVQESTKLTESETSDGAEEHVVHIWSVHKHTHALSKCLKLKASVTGSVDESSHRIFSPFAGSEVSGLRLYRSFHF